MKADGQSGLGSTKHDRSLSHVGVNSGHPGDLVESGRKEKEKKNTTTHMRSRIINALVLNVRRLTHGLAGPRALDKRLRPKRRLEEGLPGRDLHTAIPLNGSMREMLSERSLQCALLKLKLRRK